jgi:hypothetical protein
MTIPGSANPLLLASAAAEPTAYEIERSVRFNSADSAYLSRTPASAGNRKTWTWAGWVKRSKISASQRIFSTGTTLSDAFFAYLDFNASDQLEFAAASTTWRITSSVYRDLSAWYHILIVLDTTQATSSDRVKLYANGVEITAFGTNNAPTLNGEYGVNNTEPFNIARSAYGAGGNYFNGYFADIHFIDGQALDPTSFGEFDDNGIWQPIAYTGTYGTNGFHLDFADNSTAAALGTDTSGNGNTWTVNNITSSYITGSAFFNAPLNATPFTDSSASSVAITNVGSVVTASAGTNSFDITTAASFNATRHLSTSSFTLPSQYTIDYFYLSNASQTYGNATVIDGGAENTLRDYGSSTIRYVRTKSSAGTTDLSYSITANTWYHIRVTNDGVWVNGSRIGTPRNMAGRSAVYYIGTYNNDSASYLWNGLIGSVRFVNANLGAPPFGGLITSAGVLSNTGTAPTGASDDSLVDVPTNGAETDTGVGGEVRGNYCTLNPLQYSGAATAVANGSLDVTIDRNSSIRSTFYVSSGKWYYEVTVNTLNNLYLGLASNGGSPASYTTSQAFGVNNGGDFFENNSLQTEDSIALAAGSIYGIAFDADAQLFWISKDGQWYSCDRTPDITITKADVEAGTYGYDFSTLTGTAYTPHFGNSTTAGANISANFGQRPFAYTAPSGFKALCTANLPAPTIEDGSTAMDVALYTGNGSTQTISGLGFSPDLVWIKNRAQADNHKLLDTVRGATEELESNTTDAEATNADGLTAFNSDGFDLGADVEYNTSSEAYVAWTWDAGSSTVTNTDGSISSQVRANASAGFSIVSYTGAGGVSTIGHGLGVAPGMFIVKDRDNAYSWHVYHQSISNTLTLLLESTAAATNYGAWNATSATSSVFTVNGTGVNALNQKHIAYCFAPVESYSAFGSYIGDNAATSDSNFVYLGFRPRFLMIKCSSSSSFAHWHMLDSARDTYNVAYNRLAANSSAAENSYGWGPNTANSVVDFLSNGFKIRTSGTDGLNRAETHIYAAFAENPFALNNRAR